MQTNVESGSSQAVNAALARVGRLPLANVVEKPLRTMGYEDDPYVDCPYDDYQDYNDSTDE